MPLQQPKPYLFMRRTYGNTIVLLFTTIFLVNNVLFSQDAAITGTIKYGNEVLQGATVSLGNKTTVTDLNGTFSFSIMPGSYTIIITHAGYKKIEQTINAEAGSIKNVDFDMIPDDLLTEVMLGSRSKIQRSNSNTPVPVDVFSFGKLVETGQITLTQMLNFLSPSLTASREVLNEPVTLRGLDPQHVLILVNGIRYHNMAWLFSGGLKGQLGKGSAGNDLNSIPFPAIEKIEVLRDGAAAQYGSDAIAGVINIRLKKNEGTYFNTQAGQFYKSDGEKFMAGIYHGFPLQKNGFLGLSVYYCNQAATSRGATYEGLIYLNYPTGATLQDSINTRQQDDLLVKSRGFNRRAVIDNAGNTKFIRKGISINGGFPINDRTEIFLTALVNSRKIDRGTFFRLPRDSARINYLLYPDGVQPRGRSNTVDVSLIAGVKGKTKNEIHWDISSSYGINSLRNGSTNNYNETQTFILGRNAQTSFYSGTDLFKQLTSDINFSKQFLLTANQIKTLNLAWGAEGRLENYQTKLGEEASWKNFDTVNYPRFNVPGPENVVNKSRNVFGAYVELESEFKNNLLFNMAGRYEYYSDFGGNIAVKLASRYKLSSKILLRASVNNGFRAPSLQQRYLTSIGYTLNARRETIVGGIFPNTHNVVRAMNVPLLTAEKTINVSGGFTSTILKNVRVTVDAYWIQIKDRVMLSGSFDRRPGDSLDKILDQYPELDAINRVSFFANAINTRTKGIDIVLDGNWSNKSESFGISLAANFNATRIYGPVKTSDKLATISGSSNTLFNSEEKVRIEKGQPAGKIILSAIYRNGNTKLMIRNTRFGKTMIAPLSLPVENFSSKILTDVSLSYSLKWATVTIGANNIADIYPDRLKHYANTSQGGWVYSPEASPFGYNGGYYFVNLSLNF
jgi:iron complex outermembrane receptor protein